MIDRRPVTGELKAHQWRYMRFVMLPSPYRRRIDRAADLFAAGGGDRAAGLVEIHHPLVPWQIQELQHPAGLASLVGNDVFIVNVQDRQRQDLFPVIHQPAVVTVDGGDLTEVVAEAARGR